jgi:hypothetical protein
MPSDSNSDSNNKASSALPFILLSSISSASASRTSTPIYKEYSIGTQIKALIILNDKVLIARIIKVTGISRSQIYTLIANAHKRGWQQDTDIIIKVKHM